MTILLCSAETVVARPTQIWLKDTSIRSSTAVEISDLNSQYCDLRGRIKGNAEALHHVMRVARVSMHYAGHIARACIITYK